MANRRSRKQVHEFTHPKVTGEIPVFLVKDPDFDTVNFEIDLTLPKLAQRMPFCRTGDSIQTLVNEAQAFIDLYLNVVWTKSVVVRAKQTVSAQSGVGVEFAFIIVESAEWPRDKAMLWRNADTPWETRNSALPSGWDESDCLVLQWTPQVEESVAKLRARVVSFASDLLAGLRPNKAQA
jgi:hypothetical protein